MTTDRSMYDWVKVLHIIAVISWMAGLLYLPRLLVYHSGTAVGGEASELFKTMERRLLAVIMRPASLVAILSGGWLLSMSGFSFASLWLIGKLSCGILLVLFHGFLEASVGGFARNERRHSARVFRLANEIPTVLLILIVIFVVVKPFQ